MSYLLTMPDELVAAATDLAGIGSSISAANASAAPLTTVIEAAAADEVSAAIAALFGAHGQAYQQQGALAAVFHGQFVRSLTAGAGAYAGHRGRQRLAAAGRAGRRSDALSWR